MWHALKIYHLLLPTASWSFAFIPLFHKTFFKQWIRDTTPILRFFVPNALLPTFVDRCSFGGDLDWMPNGAWIGEGLFVNYESKTTIHWSKTVLIESYTMLYPSTAGHLELQFRPVGFRLWPCQGGDADWSVDDLRFGAGTWTWYSLWFDEISVWHLVAWKNMEEQTDGSICSVFSVGLGLESIQWFERTICGYVHVWILAEYTYVYIYTHTVVKDSCNPVEEECIWEAGHGDRKKCTHWKMHSECCRRLSFS